MDHALWLARILGPFLLIVGIWMLFRISDVNRLWNEAKNNYGFMFTGGILNLLIGLTILSTYSTWDWSLAVLLPILGWLSIIRGLLIFFAYDWLIRFASQFEPISRGWAIVSLFFGVLLSLYALS